VTPPSSSNAAGQEPATPAQHWDRVYTSRAENVVSWFTPQPSTSVGLLDRCGVSARGAVLDVGGGRSRLVEALLDRGHRDVTVLDVSAAALESSADRLGERRHDVTWVRADLLNWAPPRQFEVWHDRAVFHFLTDPADQESYRTVAAAAVIPGGLLVVGTFAEDGPESCSGLPAARYDAASLARVFAPDFVSVLAEREVHRTPGGAEQPFTWVVLRRLDPATTPPG